MRLSYFPANEHDCFSFVRQTIVVLSAGVSSPTMAGFLNSLAKMRIFKVLTAKTADEADRILGDERVHLCLLEPRFFDTDDHKYNLPRKFSGSTRFVVMTGQKPCPEGAMALLFGVSEVMDKPFDNQVVMPLIFRNAMEHILSFSCVVPKNSLFNRALCALLETTPRSVEQWAQEIEIASCTLREVWEKRGIPPKAALFLWRLYRSAFYFDYCRLFSENSGIDAFSVSENEYSKLYDMYFFKRSYWLEILGTQTGLTTTARLFMPEKAGKKDIAKPRDALYSFR
jgi:hypothetical protein